MDEHWAIIDFAPDYEVSSLGRVRRRALSPAYLCGRILKGRKKPDGYTDVRLYHDGGSTFCSVHRLVCRCFHGPQPSHLHEVAHGDGNRSNNVAANLRWATKSENYADRNQHGTHNRGERNGAAKLSAADVARIFELSRSMPSRAVAREMGICKSQVGNILRGQAWAA